MKPAAALTTVVIAVLATVVIEETRIKKLQAEIDRLRALPAPAETPPPAPEPPAETPSPEDPAPPAEAPADTPPPVAGLRTVPADYPEPDAAKAAQLAAGPYAPLHLELGLTNREAAYLEEALFAHGLEMQKLAAKWLDALADDRGFVETAMDEAAGATMERIRSFLGNDDDFATFTAYQATAPERRLLGQITSMLDQQGVALELEDERRLPAAMHEARTAVGGIDWTAPEAIRVIAAGGALERFEEEWTKQGERLESSLAEILEPAEIEAFLAARGQVKAVQLESLKALVEAVGTPGP